MYEQVFKLVKSLHNIYIKKSGITQHQFDILSITNQKKYYLEKIYNEK